MSNTEIKERIHQIVDSLDETFLKALYSMLDTYVEEQGNETNLSTDQIKTLLLRRSNHKSGKSKSYTWEEAKALVKN